MGVWGGAVEHKVEQAYEDGKGAAKSQSSWVSSLLSEVGAGGNRGGARAGENGNGERWGEWGSDVGVDGNWNGGAVDVSDPRANATRDGESMREIGGASLIGLSLTQTLNPKR